MNASRGRLATLFVVALSSFLALAAGCQTNRVTGETNFNYWSDQSDIELGTETLQGAMAEFLADAGVRQAYLAV